MFGHQLWRKANGLGTKLTFCASCAARTVSPHFNKLARQRSVVHRTRPDRNGHPGCASIRGVGAAYENFNSLLAMHKAHLASKRNPLYTRFPSPFTRHRTSAFSKYHGGRRVVAVLDVGTCSMHGIAPVVLDRIANSFRKVSEKNQVQSGSVISIMSHVITQQHDKSINNY